MPRNPEHAGAAFAGWAYQDDGGAEREFTANMAVTGDITVAAKWRDALHTVTFVNQYASGTTSNAIVVEDGATVGEHDAYKGDPGLSAPARDGGYSFAGWNEKEDGAEGWLRLH
jgi:hypothetical protein